MKIKRIYKRIHLIIMLKKNKRIKNYKKLNN